MLLTPRRVEWIFHGKYDLARVEPALFDLREYDQIAKWVVNKAGRPTDWPDPRGVALEMKYKLCPVRVGNCGGEATDDHRILYRRSVDRRAQGTAVWHGISHAVLRRYYPNAGEADAWLLTGALVVERKYWRWSVDQVAAAQPHATRWLIEQRLFALWCDNTISWAAE